VGGGEGEGTCLGGRRGGSADAGVLCVRCGRRWRLALYSAGCVWVCVVVYDVWGIVLCWSISWAFAMAS
jgi:hypothetical protein